MAYPNTTSLIPDHYQMRALIMTDQDQTYGLDADLPANASTQQMNQINDDIELQATAAGC